MTFLSWDDIEQARSRYGNTGLPPVVDAARTFLCSLNDRRVQFTNFDPTGLGNFLAGTWDRVCDKKEPPPFDLAPKGNCQWLFTYDLPISEGFNPNPPPNKQYRFFVRSWASPVLSPQETQVNVRTRNQDGTEGSGFSTYGSFNRWEASYGNPVLVSQVREQCEGSSTEAAPPIPPLRPSPPPSADDLTRTVPVPIAPNLTIPVAFVYVRPTVNVDINAPINFDIRPVINLPDFNLNLTFDAGGVTLNFYAGGSGRPFPTPQPDPRPNPPTIPSDPNPQIDLQPIHEKLEDIIDCTCPATQTTSQFLGQGASGQFALPNRTIGVIVAVQQVNPNAKSESGRGSPDVLYAGWASFARGAAGSDRLPINYASNWYPRGKNDSHFFFTCRSAYSASVTAILET